MLFCQSSAKHLPYIRSQVQADAMEPFSLPSMRFGFFPFDDPSA
jgi:hypothetical protein